MRTRAWLAMAVRIALAPACLAAGPAPARADEAARAVRAILYAAFPSANAIAEYDAHDGRAPIGQITAGVNAPRALCSDSQGTLYVSNGNNTITAYTFGAITPSATYQQGINGAYYLAAGPDDSLYVSNGTARTVEQFPPGSQTPSRTITFPVAPAGLAVTQNGDLFVVNGTGDILRFKPGSTVGESQGFALQNGPTQLGFDKDGNFAVLETNSQLVILAKDAPHAMLRGYSFAVGPPGGFAFSANGAFLFASDTGFYRLVRIAYPQGNYANVVDGAEGISGAIAVASQLTAP